MSGYVRLHRSLIGHPAFRNDAEAMAFAWLVIRAAWKPVRVRYKGRGIQLSRGQLAISVRDFAAAHERNKNWVSRVLQRLRDEDMIETDAGTGVLVITIRKYNDYQAEATPLGTAAGTHQGTRAGQARDTEQVREEGKKGSEAKASSPMRAKFQAPLGVSDGQWKAFRAQRKKPLNDRSYTLICNKLIGLAEAGYPPGDMIDLANERGWETVFEPRSQNNGRLPNQHSLRGTRPDPALDLYRAAVEAEQRENSEADRRTGVALPSYGPS